MAIVKQVGRNFVRDYPEQTENISGAIVEVGQPVSSVKLSALSKEEVLMLLDDLDALADEYMNEAIAKAVAVEVPNIITLVRAVNVETKNGYGGFGSKGGQLLAEWLRPVYVGDSSITNDANTSALGLYAGTNAGVYSWTRDFTGGTSSQPIPSQVMGKYAGMLHIGVADNVGLPPVDGVKFTISGVATSVHSLALAEHRRSGSEFDIAFQKLKKPVMVLPLKTHVVDFYPWYTATSRARLVSILVAKSEKLVK